ncbi:MAG: hypothetical protein ABF243_01760 [Celeribacter marinus]
MRPLALGLGAIIAVGAIHFGNGGGGKVDVQDISVIAINKAEPSDRPAALGRLLEARLSKEYPEAKFNGAILKAYGRALTEGATEIAVERKKPEWSLKLTITLRGT